MAFGKTELRDKFHIFRVLPPLSWKETGLQNYIVAIGIHLYGTALRSDTISQGMRVSVIHHLWTLHVLDRQPTATAGSDVVQSGRPIFDDFSQHLWPYIDNNTANVVFQMVKRLWLIRIDQ
ncbi:hypothetical protein TNCV_2976221 [Trichonephila clavipes]|nr:hypothetical protein TNCV_2976221 [Trichonephila clavipes]